MSAFKLSQITRPTLLLDEAKCRANIEAMVDKAKREDKLLRPHFKTHQSREIGQWFKSFGVNRIAVSSLSMADYFADDFNDICVAIPFNPRELKAAAALAKKVKLTLCVENPDVVGTLKEVDTLVSVMIELDPGYGRTGVNKQHYGEIQSLIKAIKTSSNLQFSGFLCHSGDSYNCSGFDAIGDILQRDVESLAQLCEQLDDPFCFVSYGDTPTFSTQSGFTGIDELRPGNGVFFDTTQKMISSCEWDQIAVCMACPVIAKYPERNQLVVYGGGVHLSKDSMQFQGETCYGIPVLLNDSGWSAPLDGCYVKGLSQEHGIIHMPAAQMARIQAGDLLGILPVHSCMTADLNSQYLTLTGDTISKFRTF